MIEDCSRIENIGVEIIRHAENLRISKHNSNPCLEVLQSRVGIGFEVGFVDPICLYGMSHYILHNFWQPWKLFNVGSEGQ